MAAELGQTRNTVRFVLAGRVEEVRHCSPTRTVLEFLREDKGLTGTKEGCAEGDCGACTVVVGELHEGGIRYQAVNSCIQFLPTLDGKLLLTVEDLAATQGHLHAVQQAMVDQHGSQCGFCTPGFVMSLFALYHANPESPVERKDIQLGLAGNLCRCTGYAPIVRAAEQALGAGRKDQFSMIEGRLRQQLRSLQSDKMLHLQHDGRHFFAPRDPDQLARLLEQHPEAVMVCGATDVGLWVTKQLRTLDTVVYLGEVANLKRVEDDGEQLRIGAAVTYTDALPVITRHFPDFASLLERLGATQVRNSGTVGGNVANGSPIADTPPALIVAGARLALRGCHGRREIDLEDYFVGYGRQDLRAGEFVEQIIIPLPPAGRLFAAYKVSKRFEQDISALCGAFSLQLDNGVITRVRICYGGMAETPKRATACERALTGQPWNQASIDAAIPALRKDYTPITDMRASATYRMQVAQNLLRRFFLEHTSPGYPVRLATSSGTGDGHATRDNQHATR